MAGSTLRRPGKQIELGERHDVIRMKVGQEHLRHIGRVDRQSGHARRQAPPAIEQQFLRSGQDERADTQSLRICRRPPGRSKQYDLQVGITGGRDRFLRVGAATRRNGEQKDDQDGNGS